MWFISGVELALKSGRKTVICHFKLECGGGGGGGVRMFESGLKSKG